MLECWGNFIWVCYIFIKFDIMDVDLELVRNCLDSVCYLVMNDFISFFLAVKWFGNEDQQSYNNDGWMVNLVIGNIFFEIGDLDFDIYFMVDMMDVGEIFVLFMFCDLIGECYFWVVQLQFWFSLYKVDLRKDYFKIQMVVIEVKKSEFISDWVGDKVGLMYIDIDLIFNGCLVLRKWIVDKMVRL